MTRSLAAGFSLRGGFSSLEFGIVALLLMLLLLFFASARKVALGRARQVSCASNLQEISLALRLYASDYDSWLPASEDQLSLLAPIMKNANVFYCPSAERLRQKAGEDRRPLLSDYYVRLQWSLDDDPQGLLVWDDDGARHILGRWNGGTADGSIHSFAAEEYEAMTANLSRARPHISATAQEYRFD